MAPQTKPNPEWARFSDAMRKIINVPHSEIKEHLDREKEAKKLKRTRKSRYAAFRAVNSSDQNG
jgi:predicted GIY-YIG superfamily endonuclease